MKFNFKKLPGSMIELEVVLDQKEFQEYWQNTYDQAIADVHLKGFRPGTAPRELADQAVDKEKVFQKATEEAVKYSLEDIAKENHWMTIDKPKIEVDEHKLGLKYKGVLTVFPEIKLGNYKKIAKRFFTDFSRWRQEIKTEPAEINKAMEWLRQSRKQGEKIPELNDEFAKSLGGFQNLEELKKSVAGGLIMEKEYRERDRRRLKILEEIIKDSQLDIPSIMIEKTLDQMTAGAAGNKNDLREKLKDKAKNNVAANLALYKIAEEEKIEYNPEQGVDNEKVFQHLENLAA